MEEYDINLSFEDIDGEEHDIQVDTDTAEGVMQDIASSLGFECVPITVDQDIDPDEEE